MFENFKNIFKKTKRKELLKPSSKDTAKERLHLVLMQDRANVSADFLDLMRREIIEVIKKYIEIDEEAMDVRLTTDANEEGIQGPPALYANIPIINIKDETRKLSKTNENDKVIKTVESAENKCEEVIKEDTNEKEENIQIEETNENEHKNQNEYKNQNDVSKKETDDESNQKENKELNSEIKIDKEEIDKEEKNNEE